MKHKKKYIALYISSIIILIIILSFTNYLKNKNINFQNNTLLKQAQTHFKDQINNRKWRNSFKSKSCMDDKRVV